MKKFLCIFLIISIIIIPFCSLPASALGVEDALEYALGWLIDTSCNISDGTNGCGTDLINWYNSPEGQIYLTYLKTNPLFTQYGNYLSGYVKDANEAWYSVAEMKKEQVDLLFDTLNGYWTSDSAPIRNITMSSLGINTNTASVNYCGYFRGTNGIVSHDVSDTKNLTFYSEFTNAQNTIFVYQGSEKCPPIITVGYGTSIGISGLNGATQGQYVILNSNCDTFYLSNAGLGTGLQFYYLDSSIPNHFDCIRNRAWITPQLWTNGTKLNEYTDFDAVYALDLFTKSIGLHICKDVSSPVPQPDTIPYDNDNNVIVLVPLSEPSEPLYLAPNVFNNYLANNTYMTYNEGDTVVNNVTNDTMIQQFNNVYNNNTTNNGGEGGSYNDTNLINRLSNWFNAVLSKLEEIIHKLPPSNNNPPTSSNSSSDSDSDSSSDSDSDTGYGLPKWLKWLEPEPIYINFGDCIINNIPIITTIQTMARDMKPTSSTSGFSDIQYYQSEQNSDIQSYFQGNVIDLSWYYPYRERIRNLLKIPCYIMGLGAIWIAIKSIFGIHTAGGAE